VQTLRAVFVLVLSLSSTGVWAGETANTPAGAYIVCGDEVEPGRCRVARRAVTDGLAQLAIDLPGWRWVIASRATWHNKRPAYSLLEARTTYLREDWFAVDGRVNEELLEYTHFEGRSRLEWVMSHELGHIVCNTHDEHAAEQAAGRIRRGSADVCRK